MLLGGLCGVAAAQSPIDAATAHRLLESLSADSPLDCDLSRTAPGLTYRLRTEFGYVASVPLAQFRGKGHELWALLQITSRDGDTNSQPSFFLRHYELPEVLNTGFAAKFAGSVQAGEGATEVTAIVFDEHRRSCRAQWQVRVSPSQEERTAVAAIAARAPTTASLGRLTILMHAASTDPGLSVLTGGDIGMLTESLDAILEKFPARDVRLVVFSLREQKELYAQNAFRQQDVDRVRQVLGDYGSSAVDVSALIRAQSLDLVTSLLNRELMGDTPPDLILFLGRRG